MFEHIQDQVNARIEEFIADITELAKEAARETLSKALGQELGVIDFGRHDAHDFRRRRRGGKRTTEEIAQTADELLDYITRNPGQRMEAMARDMNATTQELTLPIKKLISSGKVWTEGQKRATAYYPAGPGEAKGAKARRRPRKAAA